MLQRALHGQQKRSKLIIYIRLWTYPCILITNVNSLGQCLAVCSDSPLMKWQCWTKSDVLVIHYSGYHGNQSHKLEKIRNWNKIMNGRGIEHQCLCCPHKLSNDTTILSLLIFVLVAAAKSLTNSSKINHDVTFIFPKQLVIQTKFMKHQQLFIFLA